MAGHIYIYIYTGYSGKILAFAYKIGANCILAEIFLQTWTRWVVLVSTEKLGTRAVGDVWCAHFWERDERESSATSWSPHNEPHLLLLRSSFLPCNVTLVHAGEALQNKNLCDEQPNRRASGRVSRSGKEKFPTEQHTCTHTRIWFFLPLLCFVCCILRGRLYISRLFFFFFFLSLF